MTRKKMLYPKNRRTPVKHTVKTHTRKDGTKISGYTRGKGTRPQKTQRSRVVGRGVDDDTSIGVHAFTVNFTYSKKPGDGESVIVLSDNFQDATDEAWEERIDRRMPIAVETIDPDIGAALKWMGRRVRSAVKYGKPRIVKATKLGAKYAVRATMVTGKTIGRVAKAGAEGVVVLGKLTAFGLQKELIQSLLGLCYQDDVGKRNAARIALKKQFPEVYDACDFSRESRRRPRARAPKVVSLPKRYVRVP